MYDPTRPFRFQIFKYYYPELAMTIEMEEEPVSWFTIACLVTAVAVAFTYRFFGPDLLNPEAQEKKKKSEKVSNHLYLSLIHI